VSYLVQGRTVAAVPMIPLSHDVRYLPAVGFAAAGGLAAVTARAALGGQGWSGRLGITTQVGYKSAGFVPGERLRSGALVRAGLTVALDRSSQTGS